MIVTIDAGNTRIKWGIAEGGVWRVQDALPTDEADRFSELARRLPGSALFAVCNVAGDAVAMALRSALAGRPQVWLRSTAAACGVRNGYEQPQQLGVDRWAALIGARALVGGACLVVSAGTATTIDILDAEGVFQGGAILPGYELMRRSLARDTAQLPLAEGHYAMPPRNTMDAIVSGCLQAQAGAIERMHRQLPPGSPCVLTGGAAPLLADLPGLAALPLRRIDNLVLEGLLRFAADSADEA